MEHIRRFNNKTFASLKTKNYRLYFIGQIISFTGTWMQTVAQGLLVLKLTNSGTVLGLVLGLQFLPVLLFAPFAGVFIDRFSKKKIIFLTQATAGLLALLLGLLVVSNLIQIWMVYIFAICLGITNAFDNPARHTFTMELVGNKLLKNAVVLNATLVNIARIVGPAIGGVLAATVGLGPCFLINAITYLAVLLTLVMIDKQQLFIAPKAEQKRGQLQEGFRYVLATPILANSLLMACILGTFTYNFSVILPLFATFTFHTSAGYAILTSAMSTGAVIGGLISANKLKTSPRALILVAFLFGIALLSASIMPTLQTAVVAMVLVGGFSIAFTSLTTTLLQLNAAPQMRGRVMSLWTMSFLGTTPIGSPIIGWIGEHFGARMGLQVGGLAAILAAGLGLLFLAKTTHEPSTIMLAPRE